MSSSRRNAPLLSPAWEEGTDRLARRLRMKLGLPVEVLVTDNTHTMLSYTRMRRLARVRLHHMFIGANDDVLNLVAAYIRGEGRHASAPLDAFIEANKGLIRALPPRERQKRMRLRARGQAHRLDTMLARLARTFPASTRDVAISWAPVPRVRLPRKSIKLGSYSADTQVIRIHPALDSRSVPRYFIEWIVFHELLHHRFRSALKARSGQVHTPEFCRLERTFPHYERARAWERANIERLLWWSPDERTGG